MQHLALTVGHVGDSRVLHGGGVGKSPTVERGVRLSETVTQQRVNDRLVHVTTNMLPKDKSRGVLLEILLYSWPHNYNTLIQTYT